MLMSTMVRNGARTQADNLGQIFIQMVLGQRASLVGVKLHRGEELMDKDNPLTMPLKIGSLLSNFPKGCAVPCFIK